MNYKIVAAVAVIIVCSLGLYMGLSGYDEPEKEPDIIWEDPDEGVFWEYGVSLVEDQVAYEHAIGALYDDVAVDNHVFPASIDLGYGETTVGIAVSNMETGYSSETGDVMFGSAFVPLLGQPTVDPEDASEGLVITPLSEQVDGFGYLYTYGLEPYVDHYVRDGSYVKYGVAEDGSMIFESIKLDVDGSDSEYMKSLAEVCDTFIGSLYSYDDGRWLLDYSVGGDTSLRSSFLWEEVDYDAILKEVQDILESQDQKFFNYTVETNLYYSQEAVNAFLLSLQEETFMGYKVEDLIKASEELDPNEFIRVTSDGLMVQEIPPPVATPSGLVKWLTGIICAVAVAISVAVQVFVPMAFPVTGAIIGSAIDIFGQVVIFNTALENIDWTGVAVSAVAGSLSAIPGMGFLGDVAINGAAEAAYSALSGGTGEEIIASFGIGVGAGLLFGGAMKAVGGINKLVHNRVHVGETIDLKPSKGSYTKIDVETLEGGIRAEYLTKETYQMAQNSTDGLNNGSIRNNKIVAIVQSPDIQKWDDINNSLIHYNGKQNNYLADLIDGSDKVLHDIVSGGNRNGFAIQFPEPNGPSGTRYVEHISLYPNNGNMQAYHVHYREKGLNADIMAFHVQYVNAGEYKIVFDWVSPGSITVDQAQNIVSKRIRITMTFSQMPDTQLMNHLTSITNVQELKNVINNMATNASWGLNKVTSSHNFLDKNMNLNQIPESIWTPYNDDPNHFYWAFHNKNGKSGIIPEVIGSMNVVCTRVLTLCST